VSTTSQPKTHAAGLSIASNSLLIALKLVAGAVTGSVSILTEAMHSAVDLIASLVAYFSLRKAGEPADESHRYGHDKIENLAAAIEGMLILAGSGVIVYQAVRRLIGHGHVTSLGFGIGIVAFSALLNLAVSNRLGRAAAVHDSPALEGDAAHLRTDAYTSVAVLAGLALVPDELHEAAKVDGASARQRFFRITLPLLKPSIFLCFVIGMLNSVTSFDLVYVMTGGGPANATQLFATYAYQLGVGTGLLSQGAAISLAIFPILLLVVIVQLIYIRRTETL